MAKGGDGSWSSRRGNLRRPRGRFRRTKHRERNAAQDKDERDKNAWMKQSGLSRGSFMHIFLPADDTVAS
jgi:hypothetical protein